MTGIPLRGQPQGSASEAFAIAKRRGAQRLDFTREYFVALYEDATTRGINPDILVAQWDLECDSGRDTDWTIDGNPAGMGIFPDGSSQGLTFSSKIAARAQVTHMCAYVGIMPPATWIATDARWQAVQDAGFFGTVTTTDDLGNGRWATDPAYARKLTGRYAAYWGEGASNAQQEGPIMATHRFILSPGHRNDDGGGAFNEINWTYGCTVALRDAIVARGGKAWILTEEDGGNDDSWFDFGGLQEGARRCVELANRLGPFDAYISCHYNGGASPGFHAISPEADGDTREQNRLDWKLAETMARHVKATGTVGLISWTAAGPGIMSERETGVGAMGFRLGEFVGGMGFRETTTRTIVEAGSIDTSERQYITNPAWVRNVYAEALVDALEEVFGSFQAGNIGQAIVNLINTRPQSVFEEPVDRPWLNPAKAGTVPFVEAPDSFPGTTIKPVWFAVRQAYRTKGPTARQQFAVEDGRRLNEDVPANHTFVSDAIGVNNRGRPWVQTPWGSMIAMDDVDVVFTHSASGESDQLGRSN